MGQISSKSFHLLAVVFVATGILSCKLELRKNPNYVSPENPSMVLPDGAVLAFDSAVCPSGWSDEPLLNGRVIVGEGSGNTDTDGNALTSRFLGAAGGLEYTTGIPAYSGPGNTDSIDQSTVPAATTDFYLSSASTLGDFFGTESDSNLPPFIVRHYCKKNPATPTLPASAVLNSENPSCGAGFLSDTASEGRVILGSGSGNSDAYGGPLTSRTLGNIGGYEATVMGNNLPVNTSVSTTGTPSPTLFFGPSASDIYASSFDSIFGGTNVDSNLPPYIALTACKAMTMIDEIESGVVVPFELAACPSGWTQYTAASGRVIIGAGAGAGLTVRTLGMTGGHEFTTGVPGLSDTGEGSSPSGYLAAHGPGGFSTMPPDTTISGPKTDSNMPPFITLLYCRKN
jgi:hypothetical protein